MKKEHHKNIDQFFKKVLKNSANEPGFEQQDWNALQKMLDGEKKPGSVIFWPRVLSGVAAILLVALGWWLLKPPTTPKVNHNKPVVKQQPKVNDVNPLEKQLPKNVDMPRVDYLSSMPITPQWPIVTVKRPKSTLPTNMPADKKQYVTNDSDVVNTDQSIADQNIGDFKRAEQKQKDNPVISPGNIAESTLLIDVNSGSSTALADLTKVSPPSHAPAEEKTIAESWIKKPRLSVSVMASVDMNGVNSFSSTGIGQNVGLLFSARFNKVTISTGAHYSSKPYAMAFSAYNPSSAYKFRYTPENVVADCRMLDIPLNIDYQVFSKNQNVISIGTGISSYIMLKEKYTYTYGGAIAGVTSYSVNNPDQYLFSAINFQANYHRQINSKLGINVMPYLKVPLADVGYSQVRLQTAGVAIGFNWNFNTMPKPR
jgi:hypothetical protein